MTGLAVRFTPVSGTFAGVDDRGAPEWPPSPYRAFAALVSGAANAGVLDAVAGALRVLEAVGPPTIYAPDPLPVMSRMTFRQVNTLPKSPTMYGRQNPVVTGHSNGVVGTMAPSRCFGDAVVDGPVTYVWADAPEIGPDVAAACRGVFCLGLAGDSFSAAVVEADATHPGRRWNHAPAKSWRHAGPRSRAPVAGTLDGLLAAHAARAPLVLDGVACERAAPRPPALACRYVTARDPERPWAVLDVGRSHRVVDCAAVCAAVRGAAIARTDGAYDAEWVRRFVAGHGTGPDRDHRASYALLPSRGDASRRVLVWAPEGCDDDLSDLVAELVGAHVLGGTVSVLDDVPRGVAVKSRFWETTTPAVLPSRGLRDTERAVARALAHAGVRVAARYDFAPGRRDYDVPAYLRDRPAGTLSLEFDEPVAGPVAVGCGRHVGLGLLRAAR